MAFLYPHSAEDYHTEHQTILGNTTMARLSRFVPRETLAFDPLLPKDEYEKQIILGKCVYLHKTHLKNVINTQFSQ